MCYGKQITYYFENMLLIKLSVKLLPCFLLQVDMFERFIALYPVFFV